MFYIFIKSCCRKELVVELFL